MTYTVDASALTILALICVSVGFFTGLLISLFRSGGKELKPPRKDLLNVANLWRDKYDGQLWVQVDDKTGSGVGAFEGESRERVVKIATEMSAWIGRNAPQAAQPAPPPLAPASPVQAPVEAPPSSPTPAASSGDTSNPQWVSPSSSAQNVDANKPRIDFVKGIRLTLEGDSSTRINQMNQLSIAAQVDEILQDKIKGTPLENRGLRLMELPEKGMVVMIGLEKYDSVDAVPYPDIQEILKTCVAEWEKRMLG
jgi:hypothetical protein